MKIYEFNNLAGCVTQQRSRETGGLCGLYHGEQSGMECDPATPWITVCEQHSTLVCHGTLRLAHAHLPSPTSWCEACQQQVSQQKGGTSQRGQHAIEPQPHHPATKKRVLHESLYAKQETESYHVGRVTRRDNDGLSRYVLCQLIDGTVTEFRFIKDIVLGFDEDLRKLSDAVDSAEMLPLIHSMRGEGEALIGHYYPIYLSDAEIHILYPVLWEDTEIVKEKGKPMSRRAAAKPADVPTIRAVNK